MRDGLAGILIDFAERADNNGEDVAGVECSKGRYQVRCRCVYVFLQ